MIYVWEAGAASGTAGSVEAAFREALPFVPEGGEAVTEEAAVAMRRAGAAGRVPEYRRTGRAWRGRVNDGTLSWERFPGDAACEGGRRS